MERVSWAELHQIHEGEWVSGLERYSGKSGHIL